MVKNLKFIRSIDFLEKFIDNSFGVKLRPIAEEYYLEVLIDVQQELAEPWSDIHIHLNGKIIVRFNTFIGLPKWS
jgi:hypothetical protein